MMTFEEALCVYGLENKPESDDLNALYKAMQKVASLKDDEAASKRLNIARDILLGRVVQNNNVNCNGTSDLHGKTTARCSKIDDGQFHIDWRFVPDQKTGDTIILSNPRQFAPDSFFGGIFKKVREKTSVKNLFRSQKPEETWESDFKASVEFEEHDCPLCPYKALQWCQHCNTIFCHGTRDDYHPEKFYFCPGCDAKYEWDGNGSGIRKQFDAKELRSIGFSQNFLPKSKLKLLGRM